LLEQLRTIRGSAVKEVRGRGLWIGIELHKQARLYCEALEGQGILCKETHERVIRIAPPLGNHARGDRPALDRIRKVPI
jgi:ornithine--oxo-acid transaminase